MEPREILKIWFCKSFVVTFLLFWRCVGFEVFGGLFSSMICSVLHILSFNLYHWVIQRVHIPMTVVIWICFSFVGSVSIIKEYNKKDLITSEDDSHAIPPGLCNSYKDERATVDKKRGWFSLRRGLSGLLDSLGRMFLSIPQLYRCFKHKLCCNISNPCPSAWDSWYSY